MKAILDSRGNPARLSVRAHYEAALYSPTRSGIWAPIRDARDDVEPYTRNELARLGWHLYQNSPTTRGLIERLVTFTVGTGIHPFGASSDAKWNQAADDAWETDASAIEITADLPWWNCMDMACRGMFVGGDALSVPVDIGADQMPRLALYESHQIGANRTTPSVRDGVVTDSAGRVTGYVLAKSGAVLPRSLAVLHWVPERPAQYRGVTVLSAAINTARDLEDILKFEKDSVAENSRTVEVIESATGEAPGIEAAYQGATWTMPDGKERSTYYQKVFGSAPKILNPGDKYVEKRSDRPSAAWQGFVSFIAEAICLATGIPPSLIMGNKVGGADTRRESAIAQRVVERWQLALANQWAVHRKHWIKLRIEDGTLSPAPDDWARCEWQFPRAMTVDAGREAKNDRDDVRAGLLSEQEYHGRYSVNWLRHRRQIQEEARDRIKRAKWLAQDEDIPFELALSMIGHVDDSPQVDPAEAPPTQPARITE